MKSPLRFTANRKIAETMLKRFLMFAKPAAFNPEQISLQEIVENVIQNISTCNPNEGIQINTQIEPDLPKFIGDKTALTQIITNLLKNSLEAVEHSGRVELTVAHNYDRNLAVITIEDNGPRHQRRGFAQDIFTIFYHQRTGHGFGFGHCEKAG